MSMLDVECCLRRYHMLRILARICTGLVQPSHVQQSTGPGTGSPDSAPSRMKQSGSKKRSRQAAGTEQASCRMDVLVKLYRA